MNITIYTKSSCPNCVSAKALLKSQGLEYSEWDIEKHPEALARLSPDWRQMPQIFYKGERIGGLAGLQAALKQVGL
jgi:glutaredoxin 3